MTAFHHAELISTGAELLSGRSVNTHAQWLGEHLARLGITLVRDTTVPDDVAAIKDAVRTALQRVDLVFVSGGLGPTNDDVTRDAVAALFDRRVVMDEASLNLLRQRMQRAGREMNPARERQALVVEGALVLPNSAGAAPGERLDVENTTLFLLPGPPLEFRAVLGEHIVPWLAQRQGPGVGPLRERILLLADLPEADIVQRFEAAGFPPPGIYTAYGAGAGRVEVRLQPRAEISDAELDRAADCAAELLGDAVYAQERVELEELVGRLLKEHNQSLATAESCTGGLIGERITHVSGSSAYYRGGVIAYADDIKIAQLGVSADILKSEGAVSESVAAQMAEGARARFGADYGLAVTGIAGPTGGTEAKPVGLVYIALAHAGKTIVQRHQFPGPRQVVREWTCRVALASLRRLLSGR